MGVPFRPRRISKVSGWPLPWVGFGVFAVAFLIGMFIYGRHSTPDAPLWPALPSVTAAVAVNLLFYCGAATWIADYARLHRRTRRRLGEAGVATEAVITSVRSEMAFVPWKAEEGPLTIRWEYIADGTTYPGRAVYRPLYDRDVAVFHRIPAIKLGDRIAIVYDPNMPRISGLVE